MFINVLGKKIQVKRDDEVCAKEGALGLYDYGDTTIYLRSSYNSQDELLGTLIHEMGHALMDRIGGSLGGMLEEIYVETLAVVITENFNLTLKKHRGDPKGS